MGITNTNIPASLVPIYAQLNEIASKIEAELAGTATKEEINKAIEKAVNELIARLSIGITQEELANNTNTANYLKDLLARIENIRESKDWGELPVPDLLMADVLAESALDYVIHLLEDASVYAEIDLNAMIMELTKIFRELRQDAREMEIGEMAELLTNALHNKKQMESAADLRKAEAYANAISEIVGGVFSVAAGAVGGYISFKAAAGQIKFGKEVTEVYKNRDKYSAECKNKLDNIDTIIKNGNLTPPQKADLERERDKVQAAMNASEKKADEEVVRLQGASKQYDANARVGEAIGHLSGLTSAITGIGKMCAADYAFKAAQLDALIKFCDTLRDLINMQHETSKSFADQLSSALDEVIRLAKETNQSVNDSVREIAGHFV